MKTQTQTTQPALAADDDPKFQELQGRQWIALAEGNKAEAERIGKQIAKMRNKGGFLARLMSGGQ